MSTLSVIIPTLNEAGYLPRLLRGLESQADYIKEIIVADAGSKDETVAIARQSGARVVRGGMPGVGRNAGARVAAGDILLFLDADIFTPPNFIRDTLKEFAESGYAAASCLVEPIEKKLDDQIIMEATNLYMQIVSSFSPRAPGFCIFVKKEVHQKINGFDESLVMNEDHDYAKRAKKYGTFGFLLSRKVPVSMRRLEKEGLIQLAFKYLWTEMYILAGKPIRHIPFSYEFGMYDSITPTGSNVVIRINEIRKKLGQQINPLLHFSKNSLEKINSVLETDISDLSVTQIKFVLKLINKDVFRGYLKRRLSGMRKSKPVQKDT